MDFIELSRKRYSVRKFSARPVEAEKIASVLEAGRLAPTAKNSQPQKIFVIKSREALERIHKATPMTYNAPVVLMVCYDSKASYKNNADRHFPGYDGGETDAAIVTAAMMMEATDLGLGTLWARGYDSQTIYDAFPEISGLELVCLLDIGYPAEDSEPSERHSLRKELSETVSEL
ncbi:nitroreductase family protein [Treponema sp.]|uniref:nitroreductase family protein n=1 Tax=Treponema sp. TaxID=166 RepID=UPI003F0BC83A